MNQQKSRDHRQKTARKILVTGAAGFIGFHLTKRLLENGDNVIGIDNLSDYYDVTLKQARLAIIEKYSNFTFHKLDIADRRAMESLFANGTPDNSTSSNSPSAFSGDREPPLFDMVVHLAAQAGIRYSLINPHSYVESNLVGFMNILEGCRHGKVKHLVFASSSSVYGANTKMPFSVHDNVDHPISLYAATKKANELMAHSYAALYNIPCTGLRFFTVYGPWGRPDMALFLFTKAILNGASIDVFNHGNMKRDFTYIDDIIEGVIRAMDRIPQSDDTWDSNSADPGTSFAPYKIYNIGNNNPVDLMEFIETLEDSLHSKVKKNYLSLQAGDVPCTYADVDDLMRDVGFKPETPIEKGIGKFVEWYREYYRHGS
ncbi:MAG TPA: NAD-dependent epimerase [Deltaproteobacteria bacterium]|nr:NAD-dependent epimerase [Deltaproteobacteria bacterium]